MDDSKISRKRDTLATNNDQFNIHKRVDSKISGQKIEVGKGQAVDEFNRSEFEDCEIRIHSGGRYTSSTFHKCKFKKCLIWSSRKQIIPTWDSSFENCLFKGKYEVRFPGPLIDCDFSMATLNSANFQQEATLGETVWPKYPHIVISDALNNYEDWKEIEKPKELNKFIYHPKTKGRVIVINLADAVNEPEKFWEIIKDKSYISTTR
ncbi:TPA: hypothetical protein NJZ52_004399 [Vibrio parahaemolyticus]|nr:hypothetical protein [Vibrio parahaemolyticus]